MLYTVLRDVDFKVTQDIRYGYIALLFIFIHHRPKWLQKEKRVYVDMCGYTTRWWRGVVVASLV